MSSSTLKKLISLYPKKEVRESEAYVVGGKMLVTPAFLMDFFGVARGTVTLWNKKGLKPQIVHAGMISLYDLLETQNWYENNVDKSKKHKNDYDHRIEKMKPKITDRESLDEVDADEADRLSKIEDVKKKRMQNEELDGKLIPSENVDRAMAELAASFVALYQGDLKLLPTLLHEKQKQEISKLLDMHYSMRVADLKKLVNKKIDIEDDAIYDKLLEFIRDSLDEE